MKRVRHEDLAREFLGLVTRSAEPEFLRVTKIYNWISISAGFRSEKVLTGPENR
jgi:hypothetical protein